MTKAQKAEQQEAIERLRKFVSPGDTVYTVLRHVSRSGMSREISLHVVSDNRVMWITGLAAKAMGRRLGQRDGLIIGGCGMDMGFAVVYHLSSTMWPRGFECAGDTCRSNDHSNGDRDRTPHHHNDGGYALKQEWI